MSNCSALGGKRSWKADKKEATEQMIKRYRKTRTEKLKPLAKTLSELEILALACAALYDGGERTELLHMVRKAGDFRSYIGWLLLNLNDKELLNELRTSENDGD